MIGYIKGKVAFITNEYCILQTGGVGYRVFMPASNLAKLDKEADLALFIYTSVREDAILLYGFVEQAQYDLFLKLITVSGIGPKVAVGILGFASPDDFALAILNQDIKMLTKFPGVGKKTAERMLLELKDKLGFSSSKSSSVATDFVLPQVNQTPYDEALQALLSLGYNSGEVMPLLKEAATKETEIQAMIKYVLKGFARR